MKAAFTDLLWSGAHVSIGQFEAGWLAFTALLWGVATIYAALTLTDNNRMARFWTFWALSLTGNLLLIVAGDALSFYIGFSLMSLSAYALVIHDGSPSARRAGRVYLQLAIVGEVALLSGLLLMTHESSGSTAFADWQQRGMSPIAFGLLLTGLGLKAGFWPLHMWLPLAHPAAPAPASAVLSGAMIKAGILGLWKMVPAVAIEDNLAVLLMGVGMFSAFYGALFGLTRNNVKEVLAYSSVSQMGYLLLLLALSWVLPEQRAALGIILLLYAAHHGLIKGALFLASDLFKSSLPQSRGLTFGLWFLLAACALAIAGFPLTSGAAVKYLMKDVLYAGELNGWITALNVGAISSTLVMLRALLLIYRKSAADRHQRIPASGVLWCMLALSPIVLPWLVPSLRAALLSSITTGGLVDAMWPVLVALLLAALALRMRWRLPAWLNRSSGLTVRLSLWLRQHGSRVSGRKVHFVFDSRPLRAMERRWNRYWRFSTVNLTATLLILVMVATGLMMIF